MVTVSVVEVEPGGVTVDGEKLHEAAVGSPEHANETGEANPFAGVIEIEVVILCPAVTDSDDGDTAVEKSSPGRFK